MLHCPEPTPAPDLPGYFWASDWQVNPAAAPMRARDQLPPVSSCGPWLSMNVLSLNVCIVCVEATETAGIERDGSLDD